MRQEFWYHSVIGLLALCLGTIILSQSCDVRGPELMFNNITSSQNSSSIGTGDGFDGKPRTGEWIRTNPNYSCANAQASVQASIKMETTTGKITNDNCIETKVVISKYDPQLDFKFYNPDFFIFNGAIFEIADLDKALQTNEAICRGRDNELGVDVIIRQNAAGVRTAQLLTGSYIDRSVKSLSFDAITKSTTSSSVTYSNDGGNMTLVIQGLVQEYENLNGTLSANLGDGVKTRNLICQKLSEQPVLSPAPTVISTFYVDRSLGSDANEGLTEANPLFSVARCASVLKPGDTCSVKNGTYTENIFFRTSGTAINRITFKNYPNHRPLLNFIDTSTAGRFELMGADFRQIPIAYVTIEGFEITNGKSYALKLNFATELVIRNNYFRDNIFLSALKVVGYRVRIEGNRFSRNGTVNQGLGIAITGQQNVIVNNIFHENATFGLSGAAESAFDSAVFADPLYFDFRDNLIANNTFAYHPKGGLQFWATNGGRVANNRIFNNMFYENCRTCTALSESGQGIRYFSPNGSGDMINNNLFFATAGILTPIIGVGGSFLPTQYNQSGNIINTQNPQFLNAPPTATASPDFHLQPTSAAINSGFDLSPTITTDFDGQARPRGGAFDMGAYEF